MCELCVSVCVCVCAAGACVRAVGACVRAVHVRGGASVFEVRVRVRCSCV